MKHTFLAIGLTLLSAAHASAMSDDEARDTMGLVVAHATIAQGRCDAKISDARLKRYLTPLAVSKSDIRKTARYAVAMREAETMLAADPANTCRRIVDGLKILHVVKH
jgi:hypothetical protein